MSAAHPVGPPSDPAAQEPLDARRRRELIEATVTSIARHGLSRTTVARVAKLAGLSPGIVSFYFDGKDGLLLATLAHVDGEFAERQRVGLERAGPDPVRQLEAMIEASFDPTVCNPERIAVWTAFWGEARAREDYMRVCDRREAEDARRVVALFEQIAARADADHLDAVALGRAFYELLSSLPEGMLDARAPFDFEAAKATCRGFLASVFPDDFSRATPALPQHAPEAALEPQPPLPAWTYTDPAFHALELESLFLRRWLLAGHASELSAPGDTLTLDLAGARAFVVRGDDGALRGFHNTCPHRGARLIPGAGGPCGEGPACPFHGWRFDLRGALRDAPAERPASPDAARLRRVAVSEWRGLVFLRLAGDGPGVEELVGACDEEIAPYRLERMRPAAPRFAHTFDANWKVVAEGAAEAPLVPPAHALLRGLLGPSVETSEVGGVGRSVGALREDPAAGWSARLYRRWLPEARHLPSTHRESWLRYHLLPATQLTFLPDRVEALQILPLGPDRCRVQGFTLGSDDADRETRAARYLGRRITRSVLAVERRLCREVQRGLRSGLAASAPDAFEPGRRRLQRAVAALLNDADPPHAPAPEGRG